MRLRYEVDRVVRVVRHRSELGRLVDSDELPFTGFRTGVRFLGFVEVV